MVFWGLSFVATKLALESVPTFTLVFARFSLAALVFVLLRKGRKWPAFKGGDRMKMVLLASLVYWPPNICSSLSGMNVSCSAAAEMVQ